MRRPARRYDLIAFLGIAVCVGLAWSAVRGGRIASFSVPSVRPVVDRGASTASPVGDTQSEGNSWIRASFPDHPFLVGVATSSSRAWCYFRLGVGAEPAACTPSVQPCFVSLAGVRVDIAACPTPRMMDPQELESLEHALRGLSESRACTSRAP